MTSTGLWSWASRSRSCDDQVPANPLGCPEVMHCAKDSSALRPAINLNWDYPSFHQVPSISQGTETTLSQEQTRGSFGEVKQEVRGPGLVFSLKAAATNRFLNKIGATTRGEDMEVSSESSQQDQSFRASDYGHDITFRERRPLFQNKECELPAACQPFSGATKIRLERHLSGDYGEKTDQEISTLGAWALHHASGTPKPPGVSSLCAMKPLYFPEKRNGLVENQPGLDGQVPVLDRESPNSSFRKRSSFDESDEFGSDRALKFLRRTAESSEQLEAGRIWGRQASFPAQKSSFYEQWKSEGSPKSESPLLERSLSADLTQRSRSASPRLRRGEPVSEVTSTGEPKPSQDLSLPAARQISSVGAIKSFVVHSANETAYVSARLPENWTSSLAFLGPSKAKPVEANFIPPLLRPVQPLTRSDSTEPPEPLAKPEASSKEGPVLEPPRNNLASQVSLSHWAGLSLDLSCLKHDSRAMSPLQLSPSNFSDGLSTTPVSSEKDSMLVEESLLSDKNETKRILEKLAEKEAGFVGEKEGGVEEASPSMRASADVTMWLSVLRGGFKRQGSWTAQETDVLKQLAQATSESEAYVQNVKQEGGLNLMIKLLKAEDEQIVEAASEIIANCNGQFQAKPSIKAFDFPGGISVKIREVPFAENGLGCKVWKAAVLMGNKLVDDPSLVAGKRVLELGAGCGLCGFVATKLGAAQVTLTDNNTPLLSNLRGSMQSLLCEMTPPREQTATLLSTDNSSSLNPAFSNHTPPVSTVKESQAGGSDSNMHSVQNGCGLAFCGLAFMSKVKSPQLISPLGLGFSNPASFGFNQPGLESSKPIISELSKASISELSKPNGGPDKLRRELLLQSRPKSPISAFHSLSFHSPPMGPQLSPLMGTPPIKTGKWDAHYKDATGSGKETSVRVRYLDWEEESQLLESEMGGQAQASNTQELEDASCPPRLEPYDTYDVILGSDCLYNASAIESLSAVIKRRMTWPNGCCLLTSAVRDEVVFDDFRRRLEGRGLKVAVRKLDEESFASRGLNEGGTFHDADYYAGGFVLIEISHMSCSSCECVS